jgi:hypothetical protein
MLKALKYIAVAVAVLVIGDLAYAATKPDTFRVERHAAMKAPAAKIQPLITDFHKWSEWSPWEKLDPNLKRTYSGAASGKGAVYAWEGNEKAGTGRMEILDVTPEKISIKLTFLKPMEGDSLTEISTVPQGDSTNVNWAMSGPQPYVSKVMCTLFSMDGMIGPDFERGLANLKALAEK